eukprot:375922-Prorocentrum_minimum.AAC.1
MGVVPQLRRDGLSSGAGGAVAGASGAYHVRSTSALFASSSNTLPPLLATPILLWLLATLTRR